MLTTPIIYNINPFDKTNTQKVTFQSIGGNQVVANEIEIYNNTTNELIYTKKEETFLLEQTIPINTLTNGIKYKIRLRTYDINSANSDWSEWGIFWCLDTPEVTITNIVDGKVNNQTYTFTGSYTQINDTLSSYKYILYEDNDSIIETYTISYDGLLTQEVTGLQDNTFYKIEIITESTNGMYGTTGKIRFEAEYIQPILNSVLTLENISSDAKVKITANIIQIIGEVISGSISYSDNDWVNLKTGSIQFTNGFNIDSDFFIKVWCKDLTNGTILTLYGQNGLYEICIETDKIKVYKKINNRIVGYYASNTVANILSTDLLFVWIKQIGGYVDVSLEKL